MIRYVLAVLVVFAVNGSDLSAQTEPPIPDNLPAVMPPSEQAIPQKPEPRRIRALMDNARQAILRGDDRQANSIFDQLTEIAREGFAVNDVATSVSVLRRVLDLNPRHPAALFNLAEIYRQTDQPIWAVDYYNQYLQEVPNDPAALFGRGSCYLLRGHYSLAIADLHRLVEELDPKNVSALANLAVALASRAEQKGQNPAMYERAITRMTQAVRFATQADDPETYDMLPDLFYRLAKLNFVYQQLLEQGPGGADYQIPLDYYKQALALNAEALMTEPTNALILDRMGLCYDGLMEIYHLQSERDPKNITAYLELAGLADRRAKIEVHRAAILALEFLKKAVEVKPDDVALHVKLARNGYSPLGMFDKAIAEIQEAMKLDPKNKKGFQELINGYMKTRAATQRAASRPRSPTGAAPRRP